MLIFHDYFVVFKIIEQVKTKVRYITQTLTEVGEHAIKACLSFMIILWFLR